MNKRAFTLIELIVVIAIIAVLSAIIAPSAYKAIEKAKYTQMAGDLRVLKTALISLSSDVGRPPQVEDYGSHPLIQDTDLIRPIIFSASQGWDGPYIERVPKIPFGKGDYRYEYHGRCISTLWAGAGFYWAWSWYGIDSVNGAMLNGKIDFLLDSSDGGESGSFRYSSDNNTVFFMGYHAC